MLEHLKQSQTKSELSIAQPSIFKTTKTLNFKVTL